MSWLWLGVSVAFAAFSIIRVRQLGRELDDTMAAMKRCIETLEAKRNITVVQRINSTAKDGACHQDANAHAVSRVVQR